MPISKRLPSLPDGAKVGCFVLLDNSSEPIFLTPTELGSLAIKQIIGEVESALAQKEAAIEERLQLAIAKENAVKELIAAQRGFVEEMANSQAAPTKKVGSTAIGQELSLPVRTVRDYAKRGIIPSRKIGKHWRYEVKEVHDAVDRNHRDKKLPLTAAARARVLR